MTAPSTPEPASELHATPGRDLLEILERIDAEARELLAELDLEALPCAQDDLEPGLRVEHELGVGARLVAEVDGVAGRWLESEAARAWIARLAQRATFAAETEGDAPCLAGRFDYRVGGPGGGSGRAALELWLGGPEG